MSAYFDENETQSTEERLARQGRRMRRMLREGSRKSKRFKAILDDAGIDPNAFRFPEDMEKMPVISREKLVEWELAEPPYGGLDDPDAEIDRIFISPGPVYEPHLSEDDPLWARAYKAAGIRKGDIALNAFSYHMVAAGLTFHNGLRKVGATVIPSGAAGREQQVQLIRDLKPTVFSGTPSFLMSIIEKAEELNFQFGTDFRIQKACFAAEPLLPNVRETLEKKYGIDTYTMYGATEVGDIGFECREKRGWHLCEEVYVEIVDPATGLTVAPGELGEIVVTRFNSVFFLVRFGTGDLSRLIAEPCPCGRTSYRIDGIAGRVGEAVKVRGLFVAPSQLRALMKAWPENALQIVVDRKDDKDVLTARLFCATPLSDALTEKFRKNFRETCTVGIDRLELVDRKEWDIQTPLIVDQRKWG
ncbi:MAG TPA: AMP-binding protein [Syntrophales bacterium]|jgi:phenylacetate-CoA ligase|nr:AMP-binding protein [Syntrophales bacterium]